MPYNPGIEDRSGQLRAQGKISQVGNIAEGLAEGFRAYEQNKVRNQALQGENDGLVKVFLQDPEMSRYAPEGIDKFLQKAQSGGGLTLDDNIRLNGMLNTAIKTKGAIQQQALQAEQVKAMQLQQQAAQAQLLREKSDEAALAAALRQFDPQQPTPEIPRLDASGLRPRVPSPTGVPELDASGLEPAPTAAPAARAQFDPGNFLREYFSKGGSTSGLDRVDTALKMLMPQKPGKAVTIGTIRSVDEKGNPIDITIDTQTGTELGRGPVTQPPRQYRTDKEEHDAALARESGTEEAKTTSSILDGVRNQAEAARMTLSDVKTIKGLYDEGATSGFGQPWLTKGAAVLGRLGYGDPKTLASQQALDTTLNRFVLNQSKVMGQGQGAMSDFERRLFEESSANPNRSREANLLLLSAMESVAERAAKMDEERLKLEDQGISRDKIARRMERMRAEIPIQGLAELARLNSDTQKAPSPASGGAPAGGVNWNAAKEARLRQLEAQRNAKK